MKMRLRRQLVTVVLGLAACREPGTKPEVTATTADITRDDDAQFQTDSLAYTLGANSIGYVGEIGVTFINRTGATVYIVNCGGSTGLSLQKRIEGNWRGVWSPVVPLCLSPPITVTADGTYRTKIGIFGGYPNSNTFPQFAIQDIAGEYRAVWYSVLSTYQASSSSFGEQLPLDARISNRFTIAVQSR
jgi:hypothetical protein